MTITITQDVEQLARANAAEEGVSVEAYVEQLILEDEWRPDPDEQLDESDPEFEEICSEVMEALEQVERGEGSPAREFFAELRAKYGVSD